MGNAQPRQRARRGMAPARVHGCAKSLLLWAFAKLAFAPTAYPHLGIHTGENRISWPVGCCEGDLVVIDFRDEQADGNDGSGMLYLNNTYVQSYRIQGQRGYTWKSYGPFCAQEGWHNFTYTSDGNPEETVFTITDSYGLIKAQGGMDDMPVRFYTYAPSKFCVPDEGLTGDQSNKRNNKLFAYHDQFTPRAKLIEEGFGAPQDKWPPLTVFDNDDFTKNVRSWATV